MLSKRETTIAKAFAILMVVTEHVLDIFLGFDKTICSMLGIGGSTLFLVLSGYGVMTSFMEKGLSAAYWKNKLWKIAVPFWVITALWILISGIYRTIGLKDMAKAMLFADFERKVDGTMWYITYQMLWYILFFLTFLLFRRKKNLLPGIGILLIFSAGFYLCDHISFFQKYTWQFTVNAIAFPLGTGMAYISKAGNGRALTWRGKTLAVIPALAYLTGFYFMNEKGKVTTLLAGICVTICTLVLVKSISPDRKVLYAIGTVSYAVYLLEAKLFTPVLNMEMSKPIHEVIVYMGILILSTAVYWLATYALIKAKEKMWKKEKQ